jgi:predicted RNase H-like HicB family nuclease
MERTYTFVFDPDPDGGYVVTCPALPGLVTWGATLDEARAMARDAMEGYIEVLVEDGEAVPESDSPEMAPRYDRLAQTLRDDAPSPQLEQISRHIAATA